MVIWLGPKTWRQNAELGEQFGKVESGPCSVHKSDLLLCDYFPSSCSKQTLRYAPKLWLYYALDRSQTLFWRGSSKDLDADHARKYCLKKAKFKSHHLKSTLQQRDWREDLRDTLQRLSGILIPLVISPAPQQCWGTIINHMLRKFYWCRI